MKMHLTTEKHRSSKGIAHAVSEPELLERLRREASRITRELEAGTITSQEAERQLRGLLADSRGPLARVFSF